MKERLFRLLGACILIGSFAAGWLLMSYQQFIDGPMTLATGQTVVLQVEPGRSVKSVARELEQMGLIEQPHFFSWMARMSGDTGRIQAGEYQIAPGMTPRGLLENMVNGRVRQYAITILEGWNFRQVMEALDASPYLKHHLKGLDDSAIMARLGWEGEHPEGRFYPDTYHFPRGMSDIDFLRRAYEAMAQRLHAEWPERADGLPLESAYEALILASIVEKETGVAAERPEIAGVFVRRLQRGMRLQTDPTVIYGMGLNYDGNIRKKDLLNDTPYNTYTRKGLPPTPIAMPSGEAIHAALHPDGGDSIYFVSRGDGTHYFSSTLEEHQCAVLKYQIKGRDCEHPNFHK